jgi:hypothetical protein
MQKEITNICKRVLCIDKSAAIFTFLLICSAFFKQESVQKEKIHYKGKL